ncbi:MAG: hypothetical protein ACI8XB_001052 [Patiriisocius sp.]|jgi:hypothetical protein
MPSSKREIHPDFLNHLKYKDQDLVELYIDLRKMVLEIYPEAVELLYHTYALTSVYSVTEKLSDAFCMIPIYTNHFNLGFNKGTLLNDPNKILQGSGKLIRHIRIEKRDDYRCSKVQDLIVNSIEFAIEDSDNEISDDWKVISKIKPTAS